VLKCAWGKNNSLIHNPTQQAINNLPPPDSLNSVFFQNQQQSAFSNNMNLLAQMMAIQQMQRDQAAADDLTMAFAMLNPNGVANMSTGNSYNPGHSHGNSFVNPGYPQY
jgi:hypothetical protein